ncbi:MAG: cupin domain-containing protein [Candidatus Latescibacteria bacterium]|nr:cupin domain-containing protein [Candidatus Latescibacterota bacterium]MCK5380544.1 cupin domain-containing protein [Candidatus Latescibacterota bacterium]MCK5526023.1 cupin domain-containing protein [Candidatus Latescibacterota bacterium]MCK5733447.1 cupin domain-containing protein [Candidatus Latescibacterota bacterium]
MKRTNEKNECYRGGDSGVKYLMRGPSIDWGVILLKPGQRMGPHGHLEVEETFYVLCGAPKMVVDDVSYRAGAGDVFQVAPSEKHDLVNDTNETAKVVFIKTPFLPDDKVSY